MKQKSIAKFLFQTFLLSVLLFGLVHIVTLNGGLFAGIESIALLVLLLLTVVGLITYRSYGEKILFVAYSLFVVNILALWLFNSSLYLILLSVALIGLWISMPRRARSCAEECSGHGEEPMVTSAPPQKVVDGKVAPKAAEVKVESTAPKAKFTPGKYVASKRSNVYHEPKCDWAKKIQKDRQLWFADRKEALNKGYKKHSCVQ